MATKQAKLLLRRASVTNMFGTIVIETEELDVDIEVLATQPVTLNTQHRNGEERS